jgi:hypothetical protein
MMQNIDHSVINNCHSELEITKALVEKDAKNGIDA